VCDGFAVGEPPPGWVDFGPPTGWVDFGPGVGVAPTVRVRVRACPGGVVGRPPLPGDVEPGDVEGWDGVTTGAVVGTTERVGGSSLVATVDRGEPTGRPEAVRDAVGCSAGADAEVPGTRNRTGGAAAPLDRGGPPRVGSVWRGAAIPSTPRGPPAADGVVAGRALACAVPSASASGAPRSPAGSLLGSGTGCVNPGSGTPPSTLINTSATSAATPTTNKRMTRWVQRTLRPLPSTNTPALDLPAR
jgi:hypothetical protein